MDQCVKIEVVFGGPERGTSVSASPGNVSVQTFKDQIKRHRGGLLLEEDRVEPGVVKCVIHFNTKIWCLPALLKHLPVNVVDELTLELGGQVLVISLGQIV